MSRLNQTPADTLQLSIDDKNIRIIGYASVALFLVIFMIWGNLVPLQSAAIANGTVSVAGNKKTVQHVDGGIVSSINIKDGDAVRAGEIVVSLDDTAAKTEFANLKKQTTQLVAELTRWRAEQQQQTTLTSADWSATYLRETNSEEKREDCAGSTPLSRSLLCQIRPSDRDHAISEQQVILDARLAVYRNSQASMQHQITETNNKESESKASLANIQQKRSLIAAELKRNKRLERQGLVTRQKVFELESDLSDIQRSGEQIKAAISIAQDQRSRLQSDLLVLEHTQLKTATEQTAIIRKNLDEAIVQTRLANQSLKRLDIRAPIDGTVIGTQVNTIGSVIAPGATLMEIVPANASLLIESQVNPIDRDSVTIGQIAEVRFSAFDRRSSKPTPGKVTLISADSVIDPATNTPFYKTIIELTEDPAIALGGAAIYPGMQADVMIETGEQTFLEYLLSPISRSFRHAFRES